MQPRHMCLDIGLETVRRTAETVLFGCPHAHAWPPPRQQGAECLRRGVWQRSGRGPYGRGQMGQRARVAGIRLGSLPGGFGNIPRLPGIDHDDRQGGRGPRSDDGPLVAPARLQHDEDRAHGRALGDEGRDARVLVRDSPALPGRPESHVKMGFGHITTHKKRR